MTPSDLLHLVRGREELADLDPAERRLALRTLVGGGPEPISDPATLVALADWIDGFGPLSELMRDPDVTDILLNGIDEVWIERCGELQRHPRLFGTQEDLLELLDRLLAEAGVRVDHAVPIGDARLRDGSRIHVVFPPVAADGPVVSIRRFPERAFSLDDLVRRAFMTEDEADVLQRCVLDRRSIAIGGATGTGKTTLANALLGCIPDDERVVIIEETRELRPACGHWVSLVTRAPNVEGKGAVDQADLLRAALRMRPDRIVLGEARGGEASIALQAMATGHEGSVLTVHARSAAGVVDRIVDLASTAPGSPPEPVVRRRVEQAIDVVLFVGRAGGVRKLVEVLRV